MKRPGIRFFLLFVCVMSFCLMTALAEEKVLDTSASAINGFERFLRSGLPMSEWTTFFYGDLLGNEENGEEADDDGVRPMPGYVPAEEFSPEANQAVILDSSVGPNTLVNGRETCLGRGITQSETSIASYGDVVVIAWNDSRGFYCGNRSIMGWGYSLDGGKTFVDGGSLPGGRTAWSNGDPSLAVDADGTFYIAGISNSFRGMSVSRGIVSKDGITWTTPVQAVRGAGTIDKELIMVDQDTGTVYMAYSRSLQVEVIRSEDGGATWSNGVRLGSGIGAFPIIGTTGKLHVAWLGGWPSANQNMYMATSEDGGSSFGAQVRIASVCPVNVTGFSRGQVPAFASVAVDRSDGPRNGRIYVSWHSRCAGGTGDAMLSWSDDDGASWSDPVMVNDDGTTAVHFSPSVSVDEAGNVNVVFYDRRENPGTGTTNLYFAQSLDGGETFLPNIRVTEVATNWSATRADISPNMGDYISSLSTGLDVLVTWTDGRQGDPDAYFARITTDSLIKE